MSKEKLTAELLNMFSQDLIQRYLPFEYSTTVEQKLARLVGSFIEKHEQSDKKKHKEVKLKSTGDSYSFEGSPIHGLIKKDLDKKNEHKTVVLGRDRNQAGISGIPKKITSLGHSNATRINFMKDLPSLKKANKDLGNLLSKCDIGNDVGSIFLTFRNYTFFTVEDCNYLSEYVLLNCFISFLVGFIYGENIKEFHRFCRKLQKNRFKCIKHKEEYKELKYVVMQVGSMQSEGKSIDETIRFLEIYITSNEHFNIGAIMIVKEVLNDFLNDLKKRSSESYKKKYFAIEKLVFKGKTNISNNQDMYKLLRYCTESFFLTFDSFCELIFLKKVENDYLLKKIFINRGKNTTKRKNKFFLVQIDNKFCLFTNYKSQKVGSSLTNLKPSNKESDPGKFNQSENLDLSEQPLYTTPVINSEIVNTSAMRFKNEKLLASKKQSVSKFSDKKRAKTEIFSEYYPIKTNENNSLIRRSPNPEYNPHIVKNIQKHHSNSIDIHISKNNSNFERKKENETKKYSRQRERRPTMPIRNNFETVQRVRMREASADKMKNPGFATYHKNKVYRTQIKHPPEPLDLSSVMKGINTVLNLIESNTLGISLIRSTKRINIVPTKNTSNISYNNCRVLPNSSNYPNYFNLSNQNVDKAKTLTNNYSYSNSQYDQFVQRRPDSKSREVPTPYEQGRIDGLQRRTRTYRRIGRSQDIAPRKVVRNTYAIEVRANKDRQSSQTRINSKQFENVVKDSFQTKVANYNKFKPPASNGNYSYRHLNISKPVTKVEGKERYY